MKREEAIEVLSDIRSSYNCFDADEEPKYHALSMAIEALQKQKTGEQQPPYVAEIEEEYKKAVSAKWIRKPLAKALYEVWKKHDREDAERRTDEADYRKE